MLKATEQCIPNSREGVACFQDVWGGFNRTVSVSFLIIKHKFKANKVQIVAIDNVLQQ